ncbi:MAG: homocysteine S-methyltransferase family protein, partial [Xanthomonadales bacterium]|nr:homocysteine S-methyltransferase family protein [Xanthomonadales bacterium]
MTTSLPWANPQRTQLLLDALASRILLLDGAMGTMLQSHQLDEAGFRGVRFADGFDSQRPDSPQTPRDLQGDNDLLSLTQPDIIRGIHHAYLEAGADLIETNTFNSTSISQADYQLEHLVPELNREGARLAREACAAMSAQT